jgi:predicted Zn-dependent protease with MMP-like domain
VTDMVSRRRFEQLAAEAVDELPRWVRDRLENVEVLVEDEPPPDAPGMLGLYEGVPLTERGLAYTWAMPDRITLFQGPIEHEARAEGERALKRVIADTVVHEVAHFFGITDERLHQLGRD